MWVHPNANIFLEVGVLLANMHCWWVFLTEIEKSAFYRQHLDKEKFRFGFVGFFSATFIFEHMFAERHKLYLELKRDLGSFKKAKKAKKVEFPE